MKIYDTSVFELALPIILIVLIAAIFYGGMRHIQKMEVAAAEFAKACAEVGGKAAFNGRHYECIK